MRITFCSPSGAIGGAERCLLDLVSGLKQLHPDWRLDVIASEEGELPSEVRKQGIPCRVIEFPAGLKALGDSPSSGRSGAGQLAASLLAAPGIPAYVRRMSQALAESNPDIVHTNGLKMHVVGAIAAPARAQVVWHIHDYISDRAMVSRLLRKFTAKCSLAIANSESVARDLRSVCGENLNIRTVLNGVDLERFTPDGQSLDLAALSGLPPARDTTVRVGLIATMAPWKGHEVFLEAIAALPPGADVRAYIIGSPIYATSTSQRTTEDLRNISARLGISDKVGFTGYASDIPSAMRALDVVVHASTRAEPFGLVIVEAMACGRAVTVSCAGGAAEIVGGGDFALCSSPGDVTSLALNLEKLITDAGLRRTMGAKARRVAEERFDVTRFCGEIARHYNGLKPSMSGV